MKIKCEYCGMPNKSEREDCRACGAPLPIVEENSHIDFLPAPCNPDYQINDYKDQKIIYTTYGANTTNCDSIATYNTSANYSFYNWRIGL